MRILLKILFSLYYLFLAFFIFIEFLSYKATINGASLPEYYKNISIVTNIYFFLIFIAGLMNMGRKYKRYFSRKTLFLVLVSFVVWMLASYLYLYYKSFTGLHYYLFSILLVLPAFLHVVWFYLYFDKFTYDLKNMEEKELTDYSQIVDLDLPFVKIIEQGNNHLEINISTPYSLSMLFAMIFFLFWISVWIFGATALTRENIWAVFLYLPVLLVLIFFLPLFITSVFLTLTPAGVEIRRFPFKQVLHCKDLRQVEFKQICGSKVGCQYFIMHIDDDENYIRLRNKEMILIIKKILEVHLYQKKVEVQNL